MWSKIETDNEAPVCDHLDEEGTGYDGPIESGVHLKQLMARPVTGLGGDRR